MASMYLYSIAFLIAFALAQSSDENPPVINPHSETIWMVGTVQNVAWDITGIDVWDDAGHPLTGKVILGYLIDSESQHLWEDEPLAQGIPFLQKETEVVVPDVPTGTTYFIALEGDSGNWGQLFTIINPTEPSGIAPPSSLIVNYNNSSRDELNFSTLVIDGTFQPEQHCECFAHGNKAAK
ncbi:hypothetical protein C8Q70DRAFT_1054312 [Cubamyces menziesii]|nr:hypothetical protein C8Q70DRAFT_1054312 [Cubamyces menziesii]